VSFHANREPPLLGPWMRIWMRIFRGGRPTRHSDQKARPRAAGISDDSSAAASA